MKRILSMTIALALTASAIPSTALAQESSRVVKSDPTTTMDMGSDQASSKELGKDHFKNIFFGLGEGAKKLSSNTGSANFSNLVKYAENAVDEGPEYENLANSVIREIENGDRDFFSSFENKITSGDPYSVEEAIDAGSEALTTTNISDYGDDPLGVETQCAFSLVWTLVGAVNIGLAVNVEAWVFVQTKFKFAENKNLLAGESGDLIYEKMVAGISEAYAA